MIRPVAGGDEKDEKEDGAVDARSVKEVGRDEEKEDEERRGVRRDEEEREPAVEDTNVSKGL